ncbi:VanW family protein [Filibacter tadaridae]|uniref:VanW like protein n=1 Tax=Filibacter tadaridae TaxID=2483811 RepID=A0A3P5XCQ6_9BACL|nr:VanW family protein [Filibacter tadaridae]VDC32628.1 VanW like protein [Filibacter tadaridae]
MHKLSNKKLIKISSIFLVFILTLTEISPFSNVAAASKKNDVSTIAGIQIDTDDKNEIKQLLAEKLLQWSETPLLIEKSHGTIELDTSLIQFHVNETIEQFLQKTHQPWYEFWKKNILVDVPIQFTMDEKVIDMLRSDASIVIDETIEKVNEEIGYFLTNTVQAIQSNIESIDEEQIAVVVKEIEVNNSSLELLIERLEGYTIQPDEQLSYIEIVSNLVELNDPEALDFMASLLYTLVLQSNYSILERHANPVQFKSFTPGTEAHVNQVLSKDLLFTNPNVVPGTFHFSVEDNYVTAELFSLPLDVDAEFYQRDKQEILPRTIYRYSADIAQNSEKIVEVGKSGVKVSTYRKTSEKFGSFETDNLISTDFYPPTHRVILKPLPKADGSNGVLSGESSGMNENQENESSNQSANNLIDEENKSDSNGATLNTDAGQNDDLNQPMDKKDEEVIYDKGGNIVEPPGK